jgi:hypothetical protein
MVNALVFIGGITLIGLVIVLLDSLGRRSEKRRHHGGVGH